MGKHARRKARKRAEKLKRHPIDLTVQVPALAHAPVTGKLIPFDEHLLDRARTQWQFGDWDSLAAIEIKQMEHHRDRASLALFAAAGHAQHGEISQARAFARKALDWGAERQQCSRILISGVYNSLARASAVAGDDGRALERFASSIQVGQPLGAVRLTAKARCVEQLEQLGLPVLPDALGFFRQPKAQTRRLTPLGFTNGIQGSAGLLQLGQALQQADCLDEAETVFGKALQQNPTNPDLLAAHAENAMRRKAYREAVRRWQDVVRLLGPETPHRVYERLGAAQASLQGSGGAAEDHSS